MRPPRVVRPLPGAAALLFLVVAAALTSTRAQTGPDRLPVEPAPILFVTQVPIPADFTTIGSVFGNHLPDLQSVGRGGDLWIWYPDGMLKNLTAAAGYGHDGFQGRSAIAVRDPSVHWSGERALFSMVVGAPARRYAVETYVWQIYEISGLRPGDVPIIERVDGQPADRNNITPIYASDDRVIFTSDRTRGGDAHLYPQRDEYEEAPTVTGLWSLDRERGAIDLLVHAPSGAFTPSIDSFGRLVFAQWDHLQRDQQADADALDGDTYGTFDWSDESATSVALAMRTETFPEPRSARVDLLAGTNVAGHEFNHFLPWMARQDGSDLETLIHLGRHELHAYFDRGFTDDPNLEEFVAELSDRRNPNPILNFLQPREDPRHAGMYYGIDAPEFYTHAAGQVVRLSAPPTTNPDELAVTYVTHRDTADFTDSPTPDHSGLYREPLPLATGEIVVVHTAATDRDANIGTRQFPQSRYDFRLKRLDTRGPHAVVGAPLTPGIHKEVSYYDPDELVTYSGPLWELSPVEVRARTPPIVEPALVPPPERAAFAQAGVAVEAVRAWLAARDLALVVSRNVTTRDRADRQQPFNLRVPGTATRTIGAPGKIYDVAHLQIFQADQLRGLGGRASPDPGRRVLARALHDPAAVNPTNPQGPPGSVAVAEDGSIAAFVPARRAVSWQLTDPEGTPVVRERNWLSFQPGEIRSCASCHGLNTADQAGQPPPLNTPQALIDLLLHWKTLPP